MALPSWCRPGKVLFLNPRTCGIYKKGAPRFKVGATGRRTEEIDNELVEHVDLLLSGNMPPGGIRVQEKKSHHRKILVPTYYDRRWAEEFDRLLRDHELEETTLGLLEQEGTISVQGGHGSPSRDQRIGEIPYIKVSDIRNLRVNFNPTNFIPRPLAEKFWRGKDSGLRPWDLIAPNRASSNVGEFAILLPGEQDIVLTKEVFVIRVTGGRKDGWDPFFLLWILCLSAVRQQWHGVVLMQTNREDVGSRYREIRVPVPKSPRWAKGVSNAFRVYFATLAEARPRFLAEIEQSVFRYIPNLRSLVTSASDDTNDDGG